jgi:hypothetical protein
MLTLYSSLLLKMVMLQKGFLCCLLLLLLDCYPLPLLLGNALYTTPSCSGGWGCCCD